MKPIIVANWKMNPQTLEGAKKLFNSVKKGIKNVKNVEVAICPPFVYLPYFSIFHTSYFKLGAQDCFWEDSNPPTTLPLKRAPKGAFTGEISPKMLKDLGVEYAILGHSERRRYFNETDEQIFKKIKAAIEAKLKPIFCIGETKDEREKDETRVVLESQIEKGLKKISKKEIKNITIAYEPVWAIGTGKPCDINEAQKMGLLIRKIIAQFFSRIISGNLRILYGGSVDSKNGAGYLKTAGFQGLLVGGASLDAKEFIEIVRATARA